MIFVYFALEKVGLDCLEGLWVVVLIFLAFWTRDLEFGLSELICYDAVIPPLYKLFQTSRSLQRHVREYISNPVYASLFFSFPT
jgi:hypothetical protein